MRSPGVRLAIHLFSGLFLLAAGCAAPQAAADARPAATAELPGLNSLYAEAMAPHRREVRKPIRDQRARAMRMLAAKAAELADETESWGGEARLAGVSEEDRERSLASLDGFRKSLRELQAAADRHDRSAVRSAYAEAGERYRHIGEAAPRG